MRRVSALAVLLAAWVATVLPQSPIDTVITNAQLVDVEHGRLQRVVLVAIADGRVTGVQTSGTATPPPGVTVIDAGGLTLVPGLVDVSLSLAPSLALDSSYVETQALRWGVTAARAVDVTLTWVARLAAREREGAVPLRLIPAAPRFNGPPPSPPLAATLGATRDEAAYDARSATRLVEAAARARARWIRVGPWTMPDVARAAIAAAQRHTLAVSVEPGLFTIDDAVRGGVTLLEGLGTMSPAEGSRVGAVDVQALARPAAARLTMAPRLRVSVPAGGRTGQAWAKDEDTLLPRSLRARASAARERASRAEGAGGLVARQRFVRDFAARGGRIVIATGAGAEGWPVAGLAVHQEMDALVAAGLDAPGALRAATWHGARLLGLPAPRWQAGMPADFLAVKGNPLTDLRVLRTPVFVMRQGERLDPVALAKDAARLASDGR